MAVVIAKFAKERKDAKGLISYIQGRPGKNNEQIVRELFNAEGNMTREQALSLIDEAGKGMRFFHLILSPDPVREDSRKDLSLEEITRYTMQILEDQLNQEVTWAAAEHNDHRPHRHVHIVAVMKKRLNVSDLALLREAATAATLLQRQQLDLDQTRDYRRAWKVRSPRIKPPSTGRSLTGTRVTGTPAKHHGFTRSHNPFNRHLCTCPYCLTEHDKRIETKTHRCTTCRRRLHEELKPNLFREKSRKEAEWSR